MLKLSNLNVQEVIEDEGLAEWQTFGNYQSDEMVSNGHVARAHDMLKSSCKRPTAAVVGALNVLHSTVGSEIWQCIANRNQTWLAEAKTKLKPACAELMQLAKQLSDTQLERQLLFVAQSAHPLHSAQG